MKYNFFGDEQPETFEELSMLMSEVDPKSAWVTISNDTEIESDNKFHGWTANISGATEEDEAIDIQTCGWPDKETLVADLNKLGFSEINEE